MIRLAIFNDYHCENFSDAKKQGIISIGSRETTLKSGEFGAYNIIRLDDEGKVVYFPINFCPFCGYELNKQNESPDKKQYSKIF